ncbi:MAG: YkvA family protein [Candidatus Latescibacteria bacterium]|nr:YkvA family protein [Candidatus Latescibacterota bacterium]
MGLKNTLLQISRQIKQHLKLYQSLYSDPQTPRLVRWLLWAAIGYTLLPFDLIPDFIPVLGHLDDVVIVPLLIYLALKCIPQDLYDTHYKRIFNES